VDHVRVDGPICISEMSAPPMTSVVVTSHGARQYEDQGQLEFLQ